MTGGEQAQDLSKELNVLAAGLQGPILDRALNEVGLYIKKAQYVEDGIRATPVRQGNLADLSMSGWRRRSPIAIAGRYDIKDGAVIIRPTPRSLGLVRVLTDGRNEVQAGGEIEYEKSYRSRKTGEISRRTYKRKAKRNVGPFPRRNAWNRIEKSIDADAMNGPAEVFMDAIARELNG
jgi:hypothetical protein